MPRSAKNSSGKSKGATSFRYVRLLNDPAHFERIQSGLGSDRNISEDAILSLTDRDWKISISQHATHSYYVTSITDKRNRKGCNNCAFIFEHNDLATCLLTAVFAAEIILEDGYDAEQGPIGNYDW